MYLSIALIQMQTISITTSSLLAMKRKLSRMQFLIGKLQITNTRRRMFPISVNSAITCPNFMGGSQSTTQAHLHLLMFAPLLQTLFMWHASTNISTMANMNSLEISASTAITGMTRF